MNSLWPAAPRFSCLNTRTIFRSCQQAESVVGRIAHGFSRAYSRDPIYFQHGSTHPSRAKRQGALWHGSPAVSFRTYATQRQKVVTDYNDIPANYREEEGLPFRETPLSKEEVVKIFGTYVDAHDANRIMKRIHGRRVAGTLGDPSLFMGFDGTFTRKSLAWLRKNVPVDEVEYAGRAAESELEQMEAELLADAERIGLYKPTPKEEARAAREKKKYAPNSSGKKDVYGKSGLDKIREDNLKRLDAMDAAAKVKREQQAEELRRAGRTGTLEELSKPRSNVTLTRNPNDPRIKYYTEKLQKAMPDEPLQMPAFRRLLPSAIMTLAVICASLLLVETYTPPSRGARLFPEIPPSVATISSIIFLNAVAWFAWRLLPAQRFMLLNMIFHPGYPRVQALVGSIFSHQGLAHLASNMLVIGFMGTYLHEEIGRAQFLAVFLSSGVLGGFTSLCYWTWRGSFVSSSLGASGAVCGVAACYLVLKSDNKVSLFGMFPENSWASISCMTGLVLLIGLDLLGARRGIVSVDHWNHLGGYAGGIMAAGLIKRRRRHAQPKFDRKEMASVGEKI